jgi:hypothetical protein
MDAHSVSRNFGDGGENRKSMSITHVRSQNKEHAGAMGWDYITYPLIDPFVINC